MGRCKRAATIGTCATASGLCHCANMDILDAPPPPDSLIAEYAQRDGYYTDCFEAEINTAVTLEQLICAFYTQPLFRAERFVLRVLARSPSTDADVRALAAGSQAEFAVWTVAARRPTEILMKDRSGRTLSWLQTDGQQLRFGSVVVPVKGRRGELTLGPVFHSLLSAHKFYSRALLVGAVRRVEKV